MSLLQKWRLPGGTRDPHKESGCSALGGPAATVGYTQEVTLGWAGELPGRCSLSGNASRKFWGQYEVQAEVWARLAWSGVWHQQPLAPSLLPSLSHRNRALAASQVFPQHRLPWEDKMKRHNFRFRPLHSSGPC